jgi:hypothetical protein
MSVHIPIPLAKTIRGYVLARGLLSVVEMRPVIDAGIVVPVRAAHYFCPDCSPGLAPESDRIIEVKNELYSTAFSRFRMTYVPRKSGGGKIILNGPDDYVEHGELRYPVERNCPWIPTGRRGSQIAQLTPDQMRKSGLIGRLFNKMAMDIAAQQVFGLQYNSAYLTDTGGEAQFLKMLDKNDHLATRTAALCSQMTHSIPLFMNLPVDTVMRIRREDYAAFASYRAALAKILSEHVAAGEELTVQEAKELYSDVLEPEILNLEQQAKNEQKYGVRKTALKYGVTAAVIGFGAYTGLLPAHLTQLILALGGVKLIGEMTDALTSMEKNPTKVRNSNLYFLLRLHQEQE